MPLRVFVDTQADLRGMLTADAAKHDRPQPLLLKIVERLTLPPGDQEEAEAD